jgi:hypothetical protein
MSKEAKRNIIKEKLVVCCMGGATIDNCIREAVQMALQEEVPVEFDFNDKCFRISPEAVIEDVKDRAVNRGTSE